MCGYESNVPVLASYIVTGEKLRELGECIYESQGPGKDLVLVSHGVSLQPEDISDV